MSQRIGVVVNDSAALQSGQTTTMLVQRAALRGDTAYVLGIADLVMRPDCRIYGKARAVFGDVPADRAALVRSVANTPVEEVCLDDLDAILLRANPGRDTNRLALHRATLAFSKILTSRGKVVLNDPDGLFLAQTKLYQAYLPPELTAQTLVSRHHCDDLVDFVRAHGGAAVLKPAAGSRGQDVFLVTSAQDKNLRQIAEVVTRDGYAMAQEVLPRYEEGDVRAVLLDGELLTVDGKYAAIRRVPAGNDFRSNIHAGAEALPAEITSEIWRVIRAVGPILKSHGIFLAGLDVMGGKLVEVNVYSTGGLRDAERFTGADFTGAILDRLEETVARSRR